MKAHKHARKHVTIKDKQKQSHNYMIKHYLNLLVDE